MTMSSKPLHVLIIPSWYPLSPSDIGGSFFREQALALKKRGVKVGVISPCIRSLRTAKVFQQPFGIHTNIDEGIPTFRYHAINVIPRMERLFEKMWVMLGMKLFLEYKKVYGLPDVMHVHSLDRAGFLAYAISKKYNIPYIVTEHSTAFARSLISESKRKRLLNVVSSARKQLAVSQPFSELLNSTFPNSSWVYLPNIVSDKFLEASEVKEKNDNIFTFINICMLTEKKRVDNLIKAFSLLNKKYNNIRLKIGGDGVCRNELEELAIELNADNKVEFLGALTRDEVFTQINQADAFVLSSEYETFGVVLIEALALGKPVVATRCGGPESIVTDESGVLVEKNSVSALCNGMEMIYANRENLDANKIRTYCQQNFSEDAVTDKLLHIYHTILRSKTYE
ncbi:glycosyltransferase family 4 protein [Citrobacter werkmanii]|uniref:Glycosyltransferase family 4 protein n=2 Tax=Enterobacteriaceae TaxID=543 RepID=A0AA37Z638_9ENTR|nr:glycosyltransferase family 4 protein [Citrobacter werkmanii]TKT98423.1 glycosyltransferase family 4 protein [Citrobacter sp. TBCS-15]EGT0670479.1 glycosyltransferase family 4 protein [Citrobacter werkmanii]MDT0636982.1 glycosyltransferase [Citrobacter werkmanii]HAT7590615.1 glycosyltransferase family 4 protein [Citrobacter werkmanii]